MKLRLAKKIVKAIGTPRESAYSERQKDLALNRMERTESYRRDRDFFYEVLDRLGPLGRAHVLARTGRPDMALDLLMRTPEDEWKYGDQP